MTASEKDVTPNDEEVHSTGSYISRTGPQKGWFGKLLSMEHQLTA